MTRRRLLPQYVHAFTDRHGKERLRFRRKGFATHYFVAPFGTEEFRIELRACLDAAAEPAREAGAERAVPGTVSDLISRLYRSTRWVRASRSDATRAHDRRILENFRARHGHRIVRDVTYEAIEKILAKKAATPTAANKLRKLLKRLFAYGVQLGMLPSNPVIHTEPMPIKGGGFHTWSEDEIAQYQAHHAMGTKARLALELMLWTGNRRGDAIRIGRQHIQGGKLRIVQEKTGTEVSMPVAPQLAEAIMAMPKSGHLTLLVTEYGRPFSRNGFGNRFRKWCDEAGLPGCTAHGLRKAISRRMAEANQGNQGIKSITGHKGDSEVALYTRDADRERMADQTMRALIAWEMANRKDRLATNSTEVSDNAG